MEYLHKMPFEQDVFQIMPTKNLSIKKKVTTAGVWQIVCNSGFFTSGEKLHQFELDCLYRNVWQQIRCIFFFNLDCSLEDILYQI